MTATQNGLSVTFLAAGTPAAQGSKTARMGWCSGFAPLHRDQTDVSSLMDQSIERWLPVVGWEGYYEVSDQGRVRGVDRITTTSYGALRRWRGKMLRLNLSKLGYLSAQLWKDGQCKLRKVHLLVLEAFVGPRPDGMEGCHGSAGQRDNSLPNLRWDTPSANQLDRIRDGTDMRGEKHYNSKLSREDVALIRQLRGVITQENLGSMFGVGRTTVSAVQCGDSWAWVEE